MILADTSVWIRYLCGVAPYLSNVAAALRRDQIVGHELVYGELLIGGPGGGRKILSRYSEIFQAPVLAHSQVVEFVNLRRLDGRGISWIDAHLLASALIGHHQLWTADAALAGVAKEFGIAY